MLIWGKAALEIGDTTVAIIFMSNTTHLTNFAGDQKAWPIYMMIGNIVSSARMANALPSGALYALLPIAMKVTGTNAEKTAQRTMNQSIMQEVLRHVLQPLTHPERRVFNSMCADHRFRHCVAIPAGWMADYPEHVQLANIKSGSCYWCECPAENMGDLPFRSERRATWDHNVYCALNSANTWPAMAELASRGVHLRYNVLWELDCITSDLYKPDLLHTM